VDSRNKSGHDGCGENRAGFRKRDMNPGKNKLWDSWPESRSCFAGDSFRRFSEPAMTKMLVAVLMTAFAVNVACLLGHL
jgi:hypothetical protein